MKQYSQMKDSGVEWIGDIPEHWHIDKIKYHFDIITGKVLQLKQKTSDDVLVDYITAGNILWEKVNLQELSKMWANEIEIKKIKVRNNDLLICEGGEAGRSAILSDLKNECIIQNHVHRLRSKNNSSCKFLLYLMEFFNSSGILKSMIARVTISSLPRLTLANFPMIVPKNEQKEISDYLDKKIKNIDNEISKNKKLIKLLKEKRQSVINHAVIQGLDDTVSMKDSGITWIGKIPKEWSINKIKFTSYVKGRIGWQGLRSDEFITKGPYLITGTDFIDGKIDWSTCNHVEFWRYEQNPYIQIKKNDILITKDGTIGKVAFIDSVPDQTTLNSGVMVIRTLKKKYDPLYMYWTLKSNQFIDFIDLIKQGSTIQHLYQETFENFQFVLPNSIEEQKQIVNYLDEKIKKSDSLISKVESQIQKLQEFRESLISSAVTGKIQVAQA